MGVKEVLINVHYLAEKVENFVNSLSYPIKIKIVYEDILLGTAGTLKKNQNFFKNESILLIHTDNFSSFDSKEFVKTYKNRANNIDITMMIFDTNDPNNCGVLELSVDGHVIGFYEKVKHPPTNIANGAVYILSKNVINFLNNLEKEFIDFSTDVVPHFINKINTFKNENYHIDIGTIENLKIARNIFKKKKLVL